jgi:ubiquinone/menaquinone biosynthesis C-methylase UbiE
MIPMQSEQEIIDRWTRSAPFWETHRDVIRQMFAPITDALVEDAQIGRGQTVLDVGTGSGEPALSLAALVGAEGNVVGIDPIAGMVEAARREAVRQALKNVQFEVAFADRLPFPSNNFDAAVSRLGSMFFPSPVDGVREMLRVLKPGRKVAFAAWHFAERNPFHSVVSDVMDRYVEPTVLPPDAMDAFRFAQPGKLLGIVSQAGVTAPTERLLRFNIQAALSVEDYWVLRREISEKIRQKITALPVETQAKLHREALEALAGFSTATGMSFPAEVLIVSGTKPST